MVRALLLLAVLAVPQRAAVAQSKAACGCACGLWLDAPCGPCDCIRACKMDLCDPRAKEQRCGGCDEKASASESRGGAATTPDVSRLPLGDQLMFHALDSASKGISQGLQDMPGNVGRQAEINGENARALNRVQAQQGEAAEQYLHGKAQRERAEEDSRRKKLEGELMITGAHTAAAPVGAPIDDGAVRVGASAPLMFLGDPGPVCRSGAPARRRSLQCLDSDGLDAPPPPFTGGDSTEAEAVRLRLREDLDAERRDADFEMMQARLAGYVKSEFFSEAKDKIKDFVLGKNDNGRPMSVMETVREGGKIVATYAGKVTTAFQGEAGSVPCVMASGAADGCYDSYFEHAEKLDEATKEMKRETYVLTAKNFGAEKAFDHAKHEFGHWGASALIK
jgi:hypothetical protein